MALLEVGQAAPDFEVVNDAGKKVKLSDFKGQRVVLYFYPQADTPGCTVESCAFRDSYQTYQSKDVVILGASPDTVEDQVSFKVKYSLPFTLLADKDHQVAEKYGVWDTWTRKNQKGENFTYTGIYRSTFVIDENGKVVQVLKDLDPASHASEVLKEL